MEICKHERLGTIHQRANTLSDLWSTGRGATAYKLARLFTQRISHLTPLPNRYNIENTTDLIRKLDDTPILPHFALASPDITNLYINIPVTET
jgi:hypothetical protein